MRTTIDLPDAVLAEAKAKALAAGVSLSAWVTDAVRRASEGGAISRQRIELPVWGSAGDPAPSWEQIKAMMAEEDERPYRDLLRAAEPREPYRP
jgi:hypothetical protein